MTISDVPEHACCVPADELARVLDVDVARGLDDSSAVARRARFGTNELQRAVRRSAAAILIGQFRGLIVALLVAAAAVSLAIGEFVEGLAILAVLAINAALGFVTELRAVRSMEGLRALGRATVTVRRNGTLVRLRAEELVPGDVVVLEAGDVVSADLRIVQAANLEADESTLTGESVPVAKNAEVLVKVPALAERANMLYKGTAITAGAGEAIVVGTGMSTELGRITALVAGVDTSDTPLERKLDHLGRRLAGLSLAFVAAVVLIGIATGGDLRLVVETGIALAVAAVPEGLPIVATLALARGMWRMARRNALIEQLPAVETLGSTDVILTDKTGTLTENRMTVVRLGLSAGMVEVEGTGLEVVGRLTRDGRELPPDEMQLARSLLRAAALCNDAELDTSAAEARGVGDPMEIALLVAAHKAGLVQATLREEAPEERQIAFDPKVRMMATVHRRAGALQVAAKGAPEAVLEACTAIEGPDGPEAIDDRRRASLVAEIDALVAEGLRVLAVAERCPDSIDDDPFVDMTLLGLLGLVDPPRVEVRAALEACRSASIRVVMVTGDHGGTADAIARAVGLVEDGPAPTDVILGAELAPPEELNETEAERILGARVIARCSPEQKLHLLALYQGRGFTVAMVGDGVNDAPALRRADIGVAMGKRGTEVAREAAAMVLQDDDFQTIAVAIGEGRVIYGNIRRFVIYLVSCNLSEILTVGVAALASAPLPILPMQILYLNLVTDVFPALALGVGEGDSSVMQRPPRPRGEPLMTRRHIRRVVGYGVLLAANVLGAFAFVILRLEFEPVRAVSVAFLVLALSQMWHVFNLATPGSRIWRNEITRNLWVWGALALCSVLIAAGFYVPLLARVLGLTEPGRAGWLAALGFSLVPLLIGRGVAWLASRHRSSPPPSGSSPR